MSDETKTTVSPLDILNIFNEQASSSELGVGVHEKVRLISIDPNIRKDNNGNVIKKQLFLKFKQFDKTNTDVGEKDVSFFMIDPSKDSAINNLHSFLAQTSEILSLFLTDDEIEAGFDPLKVVLDEADTREEEEIIKDFMFDTIKKKVLKKAALYSKVEKAICEQFTALLTDKIGFDSELFRLKLEESQDAKYIQIPRFDRFVEKATVAKKESLLYTNIKK